jgi:flavorubredoxin
MKTLKLKDDLTWVGALDPNLRVFDIIMYTEYGTSYNSYILKGSEGSVLFETVKIKFYEEYVEKLKENVNLEDIKYLVVNHTEPDHTGSIEKLLELIPNIQIVGSSSAIKFLKAIVNKDFNHIVVKHGETLNIGNKTLKFIAAPFLHWPDSIYTYIEETGYLFTCDSFGTHYCHEGITLSSIDDKTDYLSSLRYYFDMIMGPYKQHVVTAINKIKDLNITLIGTGHGPVLDQEPRKMIDLYQKWATESDRYEKLTVTIPYVSAYGYTEEMAKILKTAIQDVADIEVKLFNMVNDKKSLVVDHMNKSHGILFGSPTMVSDALPPIMELVMSLNPIIHAGKLVGSFGSYGWSGEAVSVLDARLKQIRLPMYADGIKVNFKPSAEDQKNVYEYGKGFALRLIELSRK